MRSLTKFINLFKKEKYDTKKILIVDDNKTCTKFNSYLINKLYSKIDITTVHTGKDALNFIKKNSFDYIILDLGLPDINGIDILRMMNIKNYDVRKVIVLTSYNEEYMKIACAKLKAHSFIEKPLDLNKLLNAIY